MNLYSTSVFLHVLSAILGLGPLTTLALVSSSSTPSMSAGRFAQLLRMVGWGLGALLVTGILIIAQTHGALGQTGWVRVSFGLFVVLGALLGVVRRRVKRNVDVASRDRAIERSAGGILARGEASSSVPPRSVSPLLWAMCTLVAAITYLMEAKPW